MTSKYQRKTKLVGIALHNFLQLVKELKFILAIRVYKIKIHLRIIPSRKNTNYCYNSGARAESQHFGQLLTDSRS